MAIKTVTIPIDFADVTGAAIDNLGSPVVMPANCIVEHVDVLRTTSWNALTLFELGSATDSDWLCKNTQHGLTGAAPGVNEIATSYFVATNTPIICTWDQGAATQGEGSIVITYITDVFGNGVVPAYGVGKTDPLPYTLLSLPKFAQVIGINPVHFAGASGQTVFPIKGNRCNDVWPRYSWQSGDQVSHYDLALAIQSAERDIAEIVGFWPAPMWIAQDKQQYPRPYRPDAVRVSMQDMRGYNVSVRTRWGKIVTPGRRAVTLVGTAQTSDGTLSYTDEDGDGFAETATIILATTLTDADEIKVYHTNTSGRQEWEIRPPRQKAIAGGNFVARFDSWLFIDPEVLGTYPTTDDFGIDISTTANYVTSVQVYREYADITTSFADLYWERQSCSSAVSCISCGGTGCAACVLTVQDGCFHIRDADIGEVVPIPATYDSVNGVWDDATPSECRDPDFVMLYYYAGDTSNEWRGDYGTYNDKLSNWWAETIAWIAIARLERPFCQCGNVTAMAIHLQEDLSRSGEVSHNVSFNTLDNPLGTRRGEIKAWQRICSLRDKIANVALVP